MNKLRTEKTQEAYDKHKAEYCKTGKCYLCEADEEYYIGIYWRIVTNQFPYDKIAKFHQLLTPVRHVKDRKELTIQEINELNYILEELEDTHDCLIENFQGNKSVPDHLHFHLIKY